MAAANKVLFLLSNGKQTYLSSEDLEILLKQIGIGASNIQIGEDGVTPGVLNIAARVKVADGVEDDEIATKGQLGTGSTALQSQIDTVDGRLDAEETISADHEGRIGTNETQLSDHDTRLASTEASLVNNAATLADHESRLTAEEAATVDHETRISSAETSITDHETRISAAETSITDHETRIGDNETELADHETRIGAAEGAITSAQGDIVNLEARANTPWTDFDFDATATQTEFTLAFDLDSHLVDVWSAGRLQRVGAGNDYTVDDASNKIIFNAGLNAGAWVRVRVHAKLA